MMLIPLTGNNIKRWIGRILNPRLIIGVFLLSLVGDFLLFSKYGKDWDEMNPIVFWGSTLLEIYILLGFTVWLTNKIKGIRFYKSLPALGLLFAGATWLYDMVEASFPALRPLHTILDVATVTPVFTLLALIGIGVRKIKVLRTKKIIRLGVSIVAVVVFFVYFNDIQIATATVYYRTINPQAGAQRLEELYKTNFDEAQLALNEANLTISEMIQNSTDADSLFAYQERIRGFFSKRDTHFTEMVRIDDETMRLRLDSRYSEFYRKRKLANENDYEAFRIYREGMQNLMDGTLSYYKFTKSYGEAAALIRVLITPDGFTQENVTRFESLAVSLDLQHNEVASLAERGVYIQELVDLMKTKNETVKLFRDLNNATISRDRERANEVMQAFVHKAKGKLPNESDLIAQWAREKRQPVFDAQDAKHRRSLDLYNQAYTYARNEDLHTILSVWKDQTPGTVDEKQKVI